MTVSEGSAARGRWGDLSPRLCGADARGRHFAGRSRERTHARRDAHVTGGVLQPPGQTRREAAEGAAVMDGSGEQPRDGGEAGGRRAGGGRSPRRPAPRSRLPVSGRAFSRHSGSDTPGSGAASQLPAPLLPRGSPVLCPPHPDPFLAGALGPPRSWRPQNSNPGASPGLLLAPLPGGRGASPLCPLRPGCFKGSLSLLSRKTVGYRPRLPVPFSSRDSSCLGSQ